MRGVVASVMGFGVAAAAVAVPSPGLDDAQALTAFTARPSVGGGSDLYAPLDLGRMRGPEVAVDATRLAGVEVDLTGVSQASRSGSLDLPTPDGELETFELEPVPVMEAGLAARHPELQTYLGTSADDPATRVAVTVTPMGMHASVQGPESWVVEPAYDRRGTTAHAVVRSEDLLREEPLVEPAVTDPDAHSDEGPRGTLRSDLDQRTPPAGEVELRTYRLALLNDPSYADYFGTQNVLAQKVVLVNRLNQIYGTDLGIRFLLIEETEKLNLDTEAKATGADGPCGGPGCFRPEQGVRPGMLDGCAVDTIGRARTVLGQLVGADAYDVGHLVLGNDAGGVAYLGVAGRDYAGAGCTGLDEPRGDVFYVDYVAHELGHQFAARHTFDGGDGFCGGNGTQASVEPGSGSSVMAYAGICGADDLQPHTDPYFSQQSIGDVTGFVSTPADDVVEVQHVSLSGFDSDGDTITLGYDGQTRTLTRGADYTKAGLESALEELTGGPVAVSNWAFDPYLTSGGGSVGGGGRPSDQGFQVAFTDSRDPDVGGTHTDKELLNVTGGPGVTAQVAETARGGTPGNGGAVSATGNSRPEVSAPKRKTIPVQTPFRLEGSAVDPDGDALTFTWEQDDRGIGTGLLVNDKRFGPLFRIFGDNARVGRKDARLSPSPGQNAASDVPVRYFPDLAQVLNGRTNAATGTCPRVRRGSPTDRQLDCYSEFLPTKRYRGGAGVAGRRMHFRLTARDGSRGGGGTSYADVQLRVRKTAGPFLVTSHATGQQLRANAPTRVTWKVNRTRKLARKVRILLSTDGGSTWDVVLANNTRNDGKQRVRIPVGTRTGNARIMVEARGNYFFDVNDKGFGIR